MSKLKELIDQLCPDGVPFKPLWELTIWDKKFNGVEKYKQKRVISYPYLLAKDMKALEQEGGNVTLLSTGEYIGHTTEELAGEYLCEGEVVTIPWGGTVKGIKYYKGKFVTADNRIATSSDSSILNNKFLYYIFLRYADTIQSFYRGAGIQHPNMYDVLNLPIPIPPIKVQEEIVRILDKFTAHAAELQAELQARKEQYEYYRNLLLTFNPFACGYGTDGEQEIKVTNTPPGSYNIIWKTMGEIGTFTRGNGLQKKDFTDTGVGCIHYGQIYTYYGTFATETKSFVDNNLAGKLLHVFPGDIILACTSENIEDVGKAVAWLGKDEIVTGGHSVVFKHKENPKYIAYFLQSQLFFQQKKKYAYGAKVIDIKTEDLAKILIPIPPLELQEKIVSILDRFETLVNDLAQGLPAEIAAVKERYEYYRNKLLTFPQIV